MIRVQTLVCGSEQGSSNVPRDDQGSRFMHWGDQGSELRDEVALRSGFADEAWQAIRVRILFFGGKPGSSNLLRGDQGSMIMLLGEQVSWLEPLIRAA